MTPISSMHAVTTGTEIIHELDQHLRNSELTVTNMGDTEPIFLRFDQATMLLPGEQDSLIVPPRSTREFEAPNDGRPTLKIQVIGVAGSNYSVELTVADNR